MLKEFSFTLSLLFLFSLPFAVSAQTVEWSNQTKVRSKTFYSQILGENTNGVYLVRCKNNDFRRDIVVEKYKNNLALELSIDLQIPSNNILEKLVLLDNNILFFYSGKNYATGKIELSCIKMDMDYKPISSPTIICEIDANQFKDNTNFYIKTSADKSKFGLVYLTSISKGLSKLMFLGFNDQLAITSRKDISLDYEVNDVFFSSIECNNEGDIFSLVTFPEI